HRLLDDPNRGLGEQATLTIRKAELAAQREHRDVGRVAPHEERFLQSLFAITDHPDALIDHLPAVANRTVTNDAAANRVGQIRQVRLDIDHTGGQYDGTCDQRIRAVENLEAIVRNALDALHGRLVDERAVTLCLIAQPR